MGTVEFASADADDAALICVPPYHIAGVGAALSNLYAGRRMVYLRSSTPTSGSSWSATRASPRRPSSPRCLIASLVLGEAEAAAAHPANLRLRRLEVAPPLVRKALDVLPDVGFVNAYGLTETSSTIAVLTPDDHRAAHGATDEVIRRRLGSVGRPVPGVEVQIREDDGIVLSPGESGELFVRGDQVSGQYAEIGSVLDADGWFPTRMSPRSIAMGICSSPGDRRHHHPRRREHRSRGDRGRPHRTSVGARRRGRRGRGLAMGSDHRRGGGCGRGYSRIRKNCAPTSAHPARLADTRSVVFRDELPTTPTGKVLCRDLIHESRSGEGRELKQKGQS